MVAPECAPAAKAGGLGDVVFGLSRELEIRGNTVEIVLPKYAGMRYGDIWGLQPSHHDLWVPWYGGAVRCTVWFGFVHGRKCFFIEPHSADNFFGRDLLYGYGDDVARFAFFSKAAVEFLLQSGKRPEVIHCHDWQAGLVQVLLYEHYRLVMPDQRVCYTIHNFRHQGVTGAEVLWATGLGRPEFFLDAARLGDDTHHRAVNLMKGGVVYSNFVTTVSPSHVSEARFGDGGFGLDRALHVHQVKFGGVLNGVDYDVWNPETDPFLPARYTVRDIDRKYRNKEALRDRFWLRKTWSPVVAYVGGWMRRRACTSFTTPCFSRWPAAGSSCCSAMRTITMGSRAISGISSITSTTTRTAIWRSDTGRNSLTWSMPARTCWWCPACSSRAGWPR
jgi:starch synthase